jgi:hypothetical protein
MFRFNLDSLKKREKDPVAKKVPAEFGLEEGEGGVFEPRKTAKEKQEQWENLDKNNR